MQLTISLPVLNNPHGAEVYELESPMLRNVTSHDVATVTKILRTTI